MAHVRRCPAALAPNMAGVVEMKMKRKKQRASTRAHVGAKNAANMLPSLNKERQLNLKEANPWNTAMRMVVPFFTIYDYIYIFRKRRYAGVVFTRFCDLWFSVFF